MDAAPRHQRSQFGVRACLREDRGGIALAPVKRYDSGSPQKP
jgi:hypothetical protein